jgi:hypothetical protein
MVTPNEIRAQTLKVLGALKVRQFAQGLNFRRRAGYTVFDFASVLLPLCVR